MINIAIAEDDELQRFALRIKMQFYKEFDIIIEESNGKKLIEAITVSDIKPDICILDIGMPVLNGYDTLPVLKRLWPNIRVLVLTAYTGKYSIVTMLKNGVNGLLPKYEIQYLHNALISIFKTGYYYSKCATKEMFDSVENGKIEIPKITSKELEVIQYMCSGLSLTEIARNLYISLGTLYKHRDNLFRKLNIHSREGLIMFALYNDLIK